MSISRSSACWRVLLMLLSRRPPLLILDILPSSFASIVPPFRAPSSVLLVTLCCLWFGPPHFPPLTYDKITGEVLLFSYLLFFVASGLVFSVLVVVPITLLGVSTVTTVLSFATAATIVPAAVIDSRSSVSR